MKHQLHVILLLSLAAMMVWPGGSLAQDTQPDGSRSDDLVHSAEFVRKKLDELLATMSDVAKLLEKTDPDVAKILRQTVIYAQQEDVVNKVDEVKRLLREGLDQAAEAGQSEVIGDLTHMLRLLEGGKSDLTETDERLAELRLVQKRLTALLARQEAQEVRSRAVLAREKIEQDSQALLARLQKLIERQKKLKSQTGKLAAPPPAVAKLSELHRAVEKLMHAQQLLNDSAARAALARLPVLAEAQRKLLEQTRQAIAKLAEASQDESIAKALKTAGGDPQAVAKAREKCTTAREPMQKTAQALEASNQAKATSPGAQALHDLHVAEKTLAEALKALLAKTPAEKLTREQTKLAQDTAALKEAAGNLAEQAGLDPKSLPKSNLPQAGKCMNQAADALEHQQRSPAEVKQAEAIRALQQELTQAEELTRQALARAKAKLDAAEQNEITKSIGETAETMKTGRNGKPMPGQASAAKAGKSSAQAGEALSQSNAATANQQQNETKKNLREAMKSLGEQIEQLERLSKAEKLASISERLEKVLERQKACTKQTRAVYDSRAKADPPYDRPAQQKLTELAAVEGDLAEEIRSIRVMLRKEGTTVVFPAVLGDVIQDLADVKASLAGFDPGLLTQATQEQIEHTLAELLESVRKELSKGPGRGQSGGGGGGGGGGQGKPPLIPPIAELRMLRMKQMRVNRGTKQLNSLVESGKLPAARQQAEYKKLTRRQEQVLELVREVRAKLKKSNQSIRPMQTPENKP